ncbi:SH3 domain-containing protein [Planococcus salinus]|uniref:N-acetylmuramoyl-L-alanine amidase n=1 Tax=Planococcus salinus TaxID=1848460 RepID=A0A3M8PB74_9BACL|nr:SH3 domain-containing protein [Planococcus salinus]RNF40968.1 N-acetylmuramoyl-L-alanine amidase [Planococcus salinus]
MGKKWLIAFILFLFIAAGSMPLTDADKAGANNGELEVHAETVNVRTGPGLSYSVSDSLEQGEKMTVLSRNGEWVEVDFGSGTGWVASWLVSEVAADTGDRIAVSSTDHLNVRAQPELSAAVLTQMNAGDQAQVLRDTGDWTEIEFRSVRGFVSTQYITVSQETEQNSAKEPIGISSFTVAVDALKVRAQQDLNSSIQATVQKGEAYPVESVEGNWVQIQLSEEETGWVYAFHGHLSNQSAKTASTDDVGTVTVLTNGTNLRSEPSTASEVVSRADAGDQLAVSAEKDDWYEVTLPNGEKAFVASWVVTAGEAEAAEVQKSEQQPDRKKGTLNGVSIVLDPGHGGNDGGTVGVRETVEKDLTLKTAEILAHHLRSAGAEVTLTRESDMYVDLRKRVSTGHQVAADAFISIHYDATDDSTIHGFTSYYLHDYQEPLANYVNEGLASKISLHDRGVQPGNYLVLRDNRQAAVLVELGFLSNYNEERILTTSQFRDQAALGLYTGIINYFDAQLEQ